VSDDDLRVLEPGAPQGEACAIDFEGDAVRAFAGEPLAVTLFAAGIRTLGRSTKFHRPRGAFCFDGHCGSCALRVDGVPNVRACMTPVRPGLRAERQNAFPSAEIDLLVVADWMFPHGMDHHTLLTKSRWANKLLVSGVRQLGGSGMLPDAPPADVPLARSELVDVCVVGAGPAGLAAAATLARLAPRARLLLVDEQDQPGGSLWAEPDGAARAADATRAVRSGEARLLSSATAIGFYPEDIDGAARLESDADWIAGTLAVTTPTGAFCTRPALTIRTWPSPTTIDPAFSPRGPVDAWPFATACAPGAESRSSGRRPSEIASRPASRPPACASKGSTRRGSSPSPRVAPPPCAASRSRAATGASCAG
jgi:hypothetical protein